jgi:adenylate kinase
VTGNVGRAEDMGAIVVTGVPGVGKSTVMEGTARAAGLRVVVYGSEMFRIAQRDGLVTDRDEMRRLEPEVQKQIQISASAAIAAMGDVIVDTHASIQTPRGYLPGLPAWVLETLDPSAIILVEAPAKDIAARRSKDATRKRDTDSQEAIALHQEINRGFAAAYATLTGATITIVQNEQGKVEEAVRAVLAAIGVREKA